MLARHNWYDKASVWKLVWLQRHDSLWDLTDSFVKVSGARAALHSFICQDYPRLCRAHGKAIGADADPPLKSEIMGRPVVSPKEIVQVSSEVSTACLFLARLCCCCVSRATTRAQRRVASARSRDWSAV